MASILSRVFFIVIAVYLAIVSAHPVHDDLESAATGHEHGRVQIKVYRGPSDGHHGHAPWGFWVKQPADDHPHH